MTLYLTNYFEFIWFYDNLCNYKLFQYGVRALAAPILTIRNNLPGYSIACMDNGLGCTSSSTGGINVI